MNFKKISYNGAYYLLNINQASSAKLFVLKPSHIRVWDLKNGDIFKFRIFEKREYANDIFQMVDVYLDGYGQCLQLTNGNKPVFFGSTKQRDTSSYFAVLQIDGTWKETIFDGLKGGNYSVPVLYAGMDYVLDVSAAIQAGYMTLEKRPIVFKDLKIGDIFKMKSSQEYMAKAIFKLVAPKPNKFVNSVRVANWEIPLVWFGEDDGKTNYLILQDDGTWKDSI